MPINSFLYPGAKVTTAYDVDNSVRFNRGDSPYFARAQGTATGATKYTLSMWIKRAFLGTEMNLIGVSSGNTIELIKFNADNKLYWYNRDASSNAAENGTSNVFRDTSAWYNLVFVYDSTQSGAANQRKLYLNGVNQTWGSANAVQSDAVPGLNLSGATINIGAESTPSLYYGGDMCEVNFIDGLALTASSFGEFDSDSPTIWKPKNASGLTFGNNGFYLDFKDSSNLGNDAAGGTDFSENNIVAADQATDTCTNNFCTVNPLDQYGTYTLSEGNCQITSGHTSWYTIGSTMAVQNGKWYWEVEFDAGTMIEIFVGVHDTSVNRTDTNAWLTGSSLFYNDAGGEIRKDGTNSTEDYGTLSAGDILGIALNMDDKQITLYKNGSAIASNVALSTSISEAMPTFLTDANDVVFKVNFGGCPSFAISSGNADGNGYGNFEYSVPSNYYSLCTKNLAEFG